MPRFAAADPATIVIGRGRKSNEAFQLYVSALAASEAGTIELEEGEKYGTMRRYLSEAAKVNGFKVRASFNEATRTAVWKRAS